MRAVGEWALVFVLAACALGRGPGEAAAAPAAADLALQSSALQLTGPTACPPGGCAGGQRIGMRYDFDLGTTSYDAGPDPNVMVCIYASTNWAATSENVARTGEISQRPYIPPTGTRCADVQTPLTGYNLVEERVTTLEPGTPGDALRFAFRLGIAGSGTGRGIARLFALVGGTWSLLSTASASSPTLTMISPPTADTVYVANDSTACGAYSPCYVNSDGDSTDGLGTGLKDAVDAVSESASIYVVGSYTVKTSTVLVNKKLTIAGVGDAQITYAGLNNETACAVGMLALDEAVAIRGLNIDDGNCTSPNDRNLLEVNSATGRTGDDDIVSIASNDLTGGDNAIFIREGNTDRVIARYNHISGNSGHALFYEGSGTSALEVTANNITSNGAAINCAAAASGPIGSRKANHNYWGASAPSQDDTHCTIAAAKRLGSPIAHNTSTPGVRAQTVLVTGTKTYAPNFGNQIAYNHTGSGGGDFNLFIVDHGYMIASGPPFSGAQRGESPSPCSNYWDVFLADGESVANNLELYFKYFNRNGETPGCLAVINSTQYCDQTSDQKKYPLFWLDPSSDSVTTWWDQVGAPPQDLTDENGQKTTCHISINEIQVTIDGSGRPSLNDLNYTPFMVGVPVIKSFKLYASSQSVRVEWITNNEPDISGFYVLRGTSASQLTPINGDLIAHSGKAASGYTYNLTDSGRANGTTYYYRLQVVRTDGNSFYSEVKSILVNAATATSPPPTRTWTPVLPTRTRTPTRVPTQRPTQNPTRTFTPSKSRTPTSTRMVLPTLTKTLDVLTPGVPETQTALAQTRAVEEPTRALPQTTNGNEPGGERTIEPSTAIAMADTPIPEASDMATPAEVAAGAATRGGPNPWSSLLLGLLAGLIMIGGAGGWWYFFGRK